MTYSNAEETVGMQITALKNELRQRWRYRDIDAMVNKTKSERGVHGALGMLRELVELEREASRQVAVSDVHDISGNI